MTREDGGRYTEKWASSGQADGLLPASKAVPLLSTSGLPKNTLQNIWRMSDKSDPRGKLSEDEFYTALKLVAILQNGGDVNALDAPGIPVPRFGEGSAERQMRLCTDSDR